MYLKTNYHLISLIEKFTKIDRGEIERLVIEKNRIAPAMAVSNPKMIGYWKKDNFDKYCLGSGFNMTLRSNRCTMQKPGKFFKHILPDSSSADIQKMVASWYAIVNPYCKDSFQFAISQDIKKYYLDSCYCSTSGSMGNSCMRSTGCQSYLDFYGFFDVKILILKNEEGKIRGRALLWDNVDFTNIGRKVFMDKVYVNDDNDIQLFIDYAIKNDIVFKAQQNYTNKKEFFYKDNSFTDNITIGCTENFNAESIEYPYCDTMAYLDTCNLDLSNYDIASDDHTYILESTCGGYDDAGDVCEDCGRRYDADYEGNYIENVGHICEECIVNYVYCKGCDEYHNSSETTWMENLEISVCDLWLSDYIQCDICDNWLDIRDNTECNGKNYCETCRDDDLTYCDNCDNYEESDNITFFDNKTYCESCFLKNLTCCDNCGDIHELDNSVDVGSETYCLDCVRECGGCSTMILNTNTLCPDCEEYQDLILLKR